MNQIIFFNDNNNSNKDIPIITKKKNHTKNIIFKSIFLFSILLLIIFVIYYIVFDFQIKKNEELSKTLYDNFSIKTLYSSDSYNTSLDVNNYVIGIIEINSIGINYPIISECTDENLKISPCKFFGPLPNEIGNLCIVAHNYNNYRFFSKINKLNYYDLISIYDLTGKKVNYYVYDKYEVDFDNLECTKQDTNGLREITLITCNNIQDNKRIVVKAREK